MRMTTNKTNYKLIGYYPHFVGLQFRLSQFKSVTIATFCGTIYENFEKMAETPYHQLLSAFNGLALTIEPIPFQISHWCIESFSLWWHSYYFAHLIDETTFRAKRINAFPSLHNKSKKTKGTHIKEIQVFINFLRLCIMR